MPEDEEGRVCVSVDCWERPSEMPEGLTGTVACMVATGVTEASLASALRRFVPDEEVPPIEMVLDVHGVAWWQGLGERKPLESWKVAVYAYVTDMLLLAHVFGPDGAVEYGRYLGSAIDGWQELDELPPEVAAELATKLASGAREAEVRAAMRRSAPEVLARASTAGELTRWLHGLAMREPVRGVKLGLEVALRHGMVVGRRDAERSRRVMVPSLVRKVGREQLN
jgi:hypothetical protein